MLGVRFVDEWELCGHWLEFVAGAMKFALFRAFRKVRFGGKRTKMYGIIPWWRGEPPASVKWLPERRAGPITSSCSGWLP